jgi:uncharacterized protein (TIGR02145 family)
MKKIVLGILIVFVLGCTKDEVVVAPLAPTELIVTNILATQVNLSWTDNSTSETGFKIQRKGTTGSYATVGTVGADVTVYEDKGLTINTAYSYRLLSYNDGGDSITYSNEVTASTDGVSVINTSEVINVRATSATVGGSVFGDGGSAITERGVVWSTSPNPTVALTTKVIDINVFNNYSFSSTITGLNLSTKYYVRAYATNEAGTAYGIEISFTTSDGVATLSTDTPSGIRAYSATVGGSVLGDGGLNITAKGIIWSTSPNPTIVLSTKTNEGSGVGVLSNTITGLNLNTKYYVRAYATNEIGSFYGSEISFNTLDGVAMLSTTTPSAITITSATSGGSINSDGGMSITAKGLIWSTSPNPTITLSTKTNEGIGIGTFTSDIIGLTAATKYYVRAYATNSNGTNYGAEVSFTTLKNSVIIGTQNWTIKNLDVTTYSDGTIIPQVANQTEWTTLTTGAWCYYNNDSAKGAIYGKLYNWYAVAGIYDEASKTDTNKRKKLAPTGYHIPSVAEWTTLIDYLGGGVIAGGKMKETGTTHWQSPNAGATNSSGFTALPGGYGYGNSGDYIGFYSYFWSSSEILDYGPGYAFYLNLQYLQGYALINSFSNKESGYSVRCIKD